jgi:hypothetical protein
MVLNQTIYYTYGIGIYNLNTAVVYATLHIIYIVYAGQTYTRSDIYTIQFFFFYTYKSKQYRNVDINWIVEYVIIIAMVIIYT